MSKDTIYRQDAINEIQRFLGYLDQDMIDRIKVAIGRLPSSEPKLDKNDMPERGDSAKFGVKTGETCAYWDRESNICALHRPSAQSEIIRCKDCKWWDFTPDNTMLPDWHRCRHFGKIHTRYEDFCSRGERRTDELHRSKGQTN